MPFSPILLVMEILKKNSKICHKATVCRHVFEKQRTTVLLLVKKFFKKKKVIKAFYFFVLPWKHTH